MSAATAPSSSSSPSAATDTTTHHRPGDATSDGNVVWISIHKRLAFYREIALRMLSHHATVELHGLGQALAATIEVGQHLIHNNRAELANIRTGTTTAGERGGSKPEVVIVLKRAAGQSYNEDEEALISMTEDDTHM